MHTFHFLGHFMIECMFGACTHGSDSTDLDECRVSGLLLFPTFEAFLLFPTFGPKFLLFPTFWRFRIKLCKITLQWQFYRPFNNIFFKHFSIASLGMNSWLLISQFFPGSLCSPLSYNYPCTSWLYFYWLISCTLSYNVHFTLLALG